ncbi:hypothetical protein FA15DRAFT_646069 [Coprinopsis marcescibilis]|uniref:Actin-like ATPase domain-containing protein n=1 Tax=Coprinopsis marcescibilis TaxID=230819 RepID=A0A5C3KLH0_COPMA|nr:hypothetical protein FA15DRAFT_646069 [Coprinopsis marcescibilis]
MTPQSLPPYGGAKRKLVLALDVGTTYSGISYCILDPGQVPEVKGVTKFPAQEHISGASKIPTVMYYDKDGVVRAAGAETLKDGMQDQAEDQGWTKSEWFKLHIQPKTGASKSIKANVPPLPPNKTVVQVLSDFLKYLYKCARSFIEETNINGEVLWRSLEDTTEYVISHPNGWEGYQQSQIKEAVFLANLVPDTTSGHKRIHFITEGEASLHFCIKGGLMSGASCVKAGEGVVVVDAGGGTIDISSYQVSEDGGKTQTFKEISIPTCHFLGSVFVSVNARVFLKKFLKDSLFSADIDHIVDRFDKATKLRFSDQTDVQYIKFGGIRDHDPSCQIRNGQLRLAGTDVAQFFKPSIQCIVKAVNVQQSTVKHVVLVGGFSASDWVYEKVREALKSRGLSVLRPDQYHVNKAVSNGAVYFYLENLVKIRIARFNYGYMYSQIYNPWLESHRSREHKAYIDPVDGEKTLDGRFSAIISKGTQVSKTTEFRGDVVRRISGSKHALAVLTSIWVYRGPAREHEWMDEDTENFSPLCRIEADLSRVTGPPTPKANGNGFYYAVQFEHILSFSATELQAQIAWKENGVEKRSPAKIVFDPNDAD